jgi:hypothetical protein
MGVAPEVPKDGGRAAEGRLRVDDLVGVEEGIDESPPGFRRLEVVTVAGEVEVPVVVRVAERRDKLPAEDGAEDADGQEKAGVPRMDPSLAIGRQPAVRDDAVDMGMPDERLAPWRMLSTPISAPR